MTEFFRAMKTRKDLVYCLEFCILRCAWEWYDVAYVLHSRNEEHETLKAQPEASMRACAKAASVEIPPHVLHGYVALFYLLHELVVAFFAHAAAYDFAYLGKSTSVPCTVLPSSFIFM